MKAIAIGRRQELRREWERTSAFTMRDAPWCTLWGVGIVSHVCSGSGPVLAATGRPLPPSLSLSLSLRNSRALAFAAWVTRALILKRMMIDARTMWCYITEWSCFASGKFYTGFEVVRKYHARQLAGQTRWREALSNNKASCSPSFPIVVHD